MDRTIISWSIPNLITINLMAWLGFLVFVFIFQMVMGKGSFRVGNKNSDSNAPDFSVPGI